MKLSVTSLFKYDVYKDSDVPWIQKIPQHWELKTLKSVLMERNEKNDPIKTRNILSLCMYRGVIPYSEKGAGGNKAKEDLTAYKLAYPNDIVLNSMNVIAGSVGLSEYFGIVSPVYYMLRTRNLEDSIRFFNTIFQNEAFQKSLSGLGQGILIKKSESTGKLNTIRMKISMLKLNRVLLPYPPPNEQTAIASFLDKKAYQIDKAIAIKEQQIARLKEYQQITIQKAVTQGLNPNVAMKDSGIEWIGKIPEHWTIKPGFTIFSENKIINKEGKENTILSLSYGKIVIKPEEKLTGLVPESFSTYQVIKPSDIIIRCTDLQNDKTSLRTGISEYNGIITNAYLCLCSKTGSNNSCYLHYFLHVLDITKAIYKLGSGLRQNLSFQDFKHMFILIPPKNEQNKIVNFIEQKTFEIQKAIEVQQAQIEKLKEYKTTLINSAVTGKIKVV